MRRFRLTLPLCILGALVGLLAGVGGFTFYYGEGFSYASNNPKTCVNCHIMRDEFSSWGRSSHHHVAVCNDCHLPHEMLPKLVAKARNGWNHSSAFTLQNFHEPIMIGPKNAAILQANCIRCHGEFVHEAILMRAKVEEVDLCVHCHQGVGHGRGHFAE